MKKFYIGTTIENLISILKEGYISTCPPYRVWKDYSKEYVYLVPYLVDEEHAPHEEVPEIAEHLDRILSVTYAFEQADFAVYELGHTKRVVMEIQGIDEHLLTDDSDATAIKAVKYPENIPVSHITRIFVDANNFSEEINTLMALMKFFDKYREQEHILDECHIDYLMYDSDNNSYIELSEEEVSDHYQKVDEQIGIKHISLVVQHNDFGSSEDLSTIYEDLHLFIDNEFLHYEYTLSEFETLFEVHKQAS